MTAKQTIKARCLDCNGSKCTLECPLFGLAKPKANVNRQEAIRQYCQWCVNKNPVNQCSSPTCSIYQYRAAARGSLHVDFLPPNPCIDDNDKQSCSKGKGKSVSDTGGAKIVISVEFQEGPNDQR
jgi:hypothetical protein